MTAAFLIAAALAPPAPAAEAAAAEAAAAADVTPGRVAALVEALSAPSRSERVNAERALIALGPAVADLLPGPDAPAAPTGAAALAALERVRGALAAAPEPAAGPSRLPVPSLPRGSVREVLEAIAERTGNRFDLSALPADALSASAPDLSAVADAAGAATFWEAVNALSAGRFAVGPAADGALRLLPPGDAPPAVTTAGPLRVEVGRAAERPRFGTEGTLLRVPVRLIAEPRVRPLSARPTGDGLTAAVGDVPLAPFNPAASREIGFAAGVAAFNVDFLPPANAAAADDPAPDEPPAVRLAGAFALTAIPGDRRFTLPLSDFGGTRSAGGATVRLDGVTPTADGVTVTAAVLYDADDGGPAFESYQTWRYDVGVRLRAADRVVEPAEAPRVVAEGAAALAVRARFALPDGADLPNARLELLAPAAPWTAAVRFEGLTVPAVPSD